MAINQKQKASGGSREGRHSQRKWTLFVPIVAKGLVRILSFVPIAAQNLHKLMREHRHRLSREPELTVQSPALLQWPESFQSRSSTVQVETRRD